MESWRTFISTSPRAISSQNQLIANFNVRAGAKLSLYGYYSLNFAHSDTAGATSFPSNPYNIGADYGRASFDVRNRVFFGGTISLPYGFRLNPFMIFNSGTPFNVTTPLDLNGDSIFNDRPCARFDRHLPERHVRTANPTFCARNSERSTRAVARTADHPDQ